MHQLGQSYKQNKIVSHLSVVGPARIINFFAKPTNIKKKNRQERLIQKLGILDSQFESDMAKLRARAYGSNWRVNEDNERRFSLEKKKNKVSELNHEREGNIYSEKALLKENKKLKERVADLEDKVQQALKYKLQKSMQGEVILNDCVNNLKKRISLSVEIRRHEEKDELESNISSKTSCDPLAKGRVLTDSRILSNYKAQKRFNRLYNAHHMI